MAYLTIYCWYASSGAPWPHRAEIIFSISNPFPAWRSLLQNFGPDVRNAIPASRFLSNPGVLASALSPPSVWVSLLRLLSTSRDRIVALCTKKSGGGHAPQHVRAHAAASRHPGRHEYLSAAAVAGLRAVR